MKLSVPAFIRGSGLTITRSQWDGLRAFAVDGALFPDSECHGEDHWRAVADQGLRLAEIAGLGQKGRAAAALFGLFHDCRRENDDWDPEHGARGSEAFRETSVFSSLDADLRSRIVHSMVLHDDGQTTDDPIVGLGWDADRSVLGRVGIIPAIGFFSVIPYDRFISYIEAGAAATRDPMSWDGIYDAAFG